MTEGREVVEDYRSKGLTLRQHPLSFLREELRRQRIHRCSAIRMMRDGRRLTVAGMVLVRQKPGSAKGVMFMTIEDETDVANLVIWPSLFEKQRRLILSSGMIGCRGRLQKEGGVTHVIAEHIIDLSHLLRSVGDRDQPFKAEHGRGDEAKTRHARPAARRTERDCQCAASRGPGTADTMYQPSASRHATSTEPARHARARPQTTNETAQDRHAAVPLHRLR